MGLVATFTAISYSVVTLYSAAVGLASPSLALLRCVAEGFQGIEHGSGVIGLESPLDRRLRLGPKRQGLLQKAVPVLRQDVPNGAPFIARRLNQPAVSHASQVTHKRGPLESKAVGQFGNG